MQYRLPNAPGAFRPQPGHPPADEAAGAAGFGVMGADGTTAGEGTPAGIATGTTVLGERGAGAGPEGPAGRKAMKYGTPKRAASNNKSGRNTTANGDEPCPAGPVAGDPACGVL